MVGDSGRLFDTVGERNGADRHKFMFGDIYGGIGHDAEQPFVDTERHGVDRSGGYNFQVAIVPYKHVALGNGLHNCRREQEG